MNITSTRKVSSTSVVSSKKDRNYPLGGPTESFVEKIDTNNNVLVGDDFDENKKNQNPSQNSQQKDNQKQNLNEPDLARSSNYSSPSIEALEASGAFDSLEMDTPSDAHKIGIYGNNQSMFDANSDEIRKQNSVKSLYENNLPLEEIDKFI